jgi:glutathione peroxidase
MNVYDFSAKTIGGEEQALARYRGQTLLIVNVASQCGFTPQYAALEALQRRFNARGFNVLGFPCDQFGHQEPGDEVEIRAFCERNYGVTFPLFAKIEVNGAAAHPLYRFLKHARPGIMGLEAIKWNFTKFLVDGTGVPVKRYAPGDKPETVAPAIEELLVAPAPEAQSMRP